MAKKPTEYDQKLRQQAEEKLKTLAIYSHARRTPQQTERLLHELQVNQIELEMQNRELIHTQYELATSKARYLDIYDQAPVGYLTINEQGVVVAANSTTATMLGVEEHDLLDRRISQFIYGEDQNVCNLNRHKIYSGMGVQTWEMRMMRPDGSTFWSLLLATPAVGGELWVLTDISERKRVERILLSRLRISEYAFDHSLDELLTKLVDEAEALTESQIGFIHFVVEDESKLTLHTWSTNTLANICNSDTQGQHYLLESAGVWADCLRLKKPLIHNDYASLPNRKGLPPGHAPVHRELVVPIVRDNKIIAVLGVGNKLTDYTVFDITTIEKLTSLAWDFVTIKQTQMELIQAHDDLEVRVAERTSELMRTHNRMKKVSFDLVWAEERERERIAGELHDQVGQSLLLAKMKLSALAEKMTTDEQRTLADSALALLITSISDIRSLTFRMRPPILDSAGILVALQWLCSSLESDYGLKVEFTTNGQPLPLPKEMRYSLYQALRELLMNVVKHAKIGCAELIITADAECIYIQVKDNGVGFDSSTLSLVENNNGYGLYNVRQRIEQIGGQFAVASAPGRGTSITVTLPVVNLTRMERNENEQNSSFGRRSSDFSPGVAVADK